MNFHDLFFVDLKNINYLVIIILDFYFTICSN